MTKDQLKPFNGRSIRFTIASLPFVGAVHYDSWRDSFRIIYPIVEEGRTRNENCPLNSVLIERITFDEQQNILTML